MRSRLVLYVSLLLAACSLAGCGALTNVSATSNVPSQYSHVWVTVQDVKFNTSASAAPGDSSWLDFPLATPVSVDLATVTNGGLAVFGSSLKIPQGNYAQMQLLLTDNAAPLGTSAQAAALTFNDQVEYLDSAGTSLTAPLNLVHPENGIILAVTLSIPSNLKAELEALNAGGSTTADGETEGTTGVGTTGTTGVGTTGIGIGEPATTTCATTTTNTATTTPVTTTTDDCTNGVANTAFAVGIDFDAEKDLVPFIYSGQPGFLLNPHLAAYDLSTAGTIQGTLTLPGATTTTDTTTTTSFATASGNPAIEVSAETLSADGTRHVVVKSTPLQADGSFVLYPLTTNATSTDSTTTTTYDLVIHGPNIQTVVIQGVPPTVAAPAAATTLTLTGVTLTTVSDYLVNVATATGFSSAGALVQFYQTVPAGGEVPYVVAQQPIDPFNNDFAGDAGLAVGPIAVVAYSGGVTGTPVSEAPSEGSSVYQVAAIAPNFNDGPLGTKVTAPAGTTTVAVTTLPPLTAATGSTSGTIDVKTEVSAPGKYTNGELILSQNGAIVAVTSLASVLDQSSGSVTFSHVPGASSTQGANNGAYELSAWVWNASNPSGTLTRESSPTGVSLSSGTTSTSVTID